jgi:Kef-type K+ transport system membrane component KefB
MSILAKQVVGGIVLTLVAVVGKQLCSFEVLGKGVDRLSVGIGMVPRGEVGLIFANIGLTLSIGGTAIIDQATFSAIVVMVTLTTMATPPALIGSLMIVLRGSCSAHLRAAVASISTRTSGDIPIPTTRNTTMVGGLGLRPQRCIQASKPGRISTSPFT